jgi:hypothetical protein
MTKIEWKLEKRKIADLKPYFKNPRVLTKDQEAHLRQSIGKFGLIDRPFINLDGTIIGGHQRLSILKTEETEIEVWIPSRSLDEKEVEELNIRHNQTGSWDFDILANEYDENDLFDWGFSQEFLFDTVSLEDEEEGEPVKVCEKCQTCGQKIKEGKVKKNVST